MLDHRRLALETLGEYGAGWHAHIGQLTGVLVGLVFSRGDLDARFEELRPAYERRVEDLLGPPPEASA